LTVFAVEINQNIMDEMNKPSTPENEEKKEDTDDESKKDESAE
jgi:hypothetical protein